MHRLSDMFSSARAQFSCSVGKLALANAVFRQSLFAFITLRFARRAIDFNTASTNRSGKGRSGHDCGFGREARVPGYEAHVALSPNSLIKTPAKAVYFKWSQPTDISRQTCSLDQFHWLAPWITFGIMSCQLIQDCDTDNGAIAR